VVARVDPHIGLLHRGTEKLIEAKTYLRHAKKPVREMSLGGSPCPDLTLRRIGRRCPERAISLRQCRFARLRNVNVLGGPAGYAFCWNRYVTKGMAGITPVARLYPNALWRRHALGIVRWANSTSSPARRWVN
jgi:hypothetical protein